MKTEFYHTLFEPERTHWWSRTRRALLKQLLARYAEKKGSSLLEVGCGSGLLLEELSKDYSVSGIDPSSESIAACTARKLTDVHQADACVLPFADATFDVVMALDVLEHIDDDQRALQEIARVVKPNGVVIFFVPAFQFLWGISDINAHHKRRYTQRELREKCTRAGIAVKRSSYFNTILFIPILLVRWVMRLLGNPVDSENGSGKGIVNAILYAIFRSEIPLLSMMNFPFGVSLFVVGRKN